ncbi:MAG TPA: histidinol-phosphatase [Acidimicrobiales bacterium]|nr:histidinol-phosphatase [Acidimicrobiales bacterium]
MLDYHLHLWEHGPRPLDASLEQVAAYCAKAQAEGVTEIALTEHLFRFRQADAVLRGWWSEDPDEAMRASMQQFWDEEQGGDLDRYVEVVLAAKAEGLPVVLGLEVDYYRDRMHDVQAILDGYPFDVLLGSVHWIGAWGFDNTDDAAFAVQWETRDVETIWHDYTTSLEELADSGVCDVLAHPDLCKITGRFPSSTGEFHDRMAEAAARSGMAAEINTNGARKVVAETYPSPDLLARFHAAGVPVTTATDAHVVERVGERRDDVRTLLANAGYEKLQAYRERSGYAVEI